MWLTSMGRLKNAHVFPVYLVSTTVPVFDHHGSDWHWRCGPRLTPEPSGQKPPMPSTYLIHSMSQRHWELKMDLHVDTVGLIKKNDYHHSDFTPSSGYHPGTYGQIYPEPSWRCLNSIEPQPWNIAGVPCILEARAPETKQRNHKIWQHKKASQILDQKTILFTKRVRPILQGKCSSAKFTKTILGEPAM